MNEQIERNRMELILALRSGRYTQLKGEIAGETKNSFCFVGLICNLFTSNPHQWRMEGRYWPEFVELPKAKSCYFIDLNNSGKTFPELADILVKDYGFPDIHVLDPIEVWTYGDPQTGATYFSSKPLEIVKANV